MSSTETRSFAVALMRAIRLRCPRCGQGGLFRGWFRMVERCPKCALRFEQDEGSRLGSAMVAYGGVTVVLLAYVIGGLVLTLPEPPVWPLVGGGVVLILIAAMVAFPFGKTIWSAMDLAMKSFDVGDRPSEQAGPADAAP